MKQPSARLLLRTLWRALPALPMAVLGACGGGGGGSSAPPPSVYVPGVYLPSSTFRDLCAVPRTGDQFPDLQGTTTDENNWLRSWSNELYLWYDEIVDQDPASFSTPAYFELMKTFALTPSGSAKDQFHYTLPTDEWLSLVEGGVAAGYGAEFKLLSAAPPRDVRIAFVQPGTPAFDAGLGRGNRIIEVDGEVVATTANVEVLNDALFPTAAGQTHEFVVQEDDGTGERTVTLASDIIDIDPVNEVNVISTASGPVGYVSFTSHIAPSEAELVAAIRQLETAGVTDLVLDVRYNRGGFLDIANELAYMIAGPAAAGGNVFYAMTFSDKHPVTNPVTGEFLSPDYFLSTSQGYSVPAGLALPSLNLERLFVLTTDASCSATEAIINGLEGISVDVIQVGTTTCGKPYGFYPFDNCGTTYFSIQFAGANAVGFADYTDGFSPEDSADGGVPLPGCETADDLSHVLGDPAEAQLAAALEYRDSGTCPAVPLSVPAGYALLKAPAGAGSAISRPPRPGLVRRAAGS